MHIWQYTEGIFICVIFINDSKFSIGSGKNILIGMLAEKMSFIFKYNSLVVTNVLFYLYQGHYWLSSKTCYRKISWCLDDARFWIGLVQSLCNLTGTTAEMPVNFQSDTIV